MKYCWFCRYDIHRPSIFNDDQGDRPAHEVKIFDSIKSVKKSVFICDLCHKRVISCISSQGLKYTKERSY